MAKKNFEVPEMEIVVLEVEDVVTTSDDTPSPDDWQTGEY